MPETETALTLLDEPFTVTMKDVVEGTIFARVKLNVISRREGVASLMTEPE